MNHTPFEDWLYAGRDRLALTQEQAASLRDHLETCPECRQKEAALRQVERKLRSAPTASPLPGFAARWQTRLQLERRRLERRQSLAVLTFSLGAAGLTLLGLAALIIPLAGSPEALLWSWVMRLANLVSLGGVTRSLLSLFSGLDPASVPPLAWVLIPGLVTEIAVLYIVAIRLVVKAAPRRVSR